MHLHPTLYTKPEKAHTRDGFGEGLMEAARANLNVLGLGADTTESTRVAKIAEVNPKQLVQMGVAEQNMMGVAAGLATAGKIPFVVTYAVFSPGRAWDQLRVSVCYSNLNVKVVGAHGGISVGPDGATHQALEDIASVRVLPNIVVVVPCDKEQTKKVTLDAVAHQGPYYFRMGREKTPVITTPETPFVLGKADVYREGKDVTIIGCGPLLYEALVAAEQLKGQNIDCEVINCHTIKPIDVETLTASARKTRCVVTVEEHQITGGLGGAVAETLSKNYPVPIEMVGMQDCFGESGSSDELIEKYGMGVKDVIAAVQKVIKRKK